MNTMEEVEREQIAKLTQGKTIPDFHPGDTLRVRLRVVEGERERLQAFEGVCIARKNAGVNSSFTVRKISYGEGVERVFPLYSPLVESIEVMRSGRVRRAKLYYLRGRAGKRARISERTRRRGEEAIPMDRGAASAADLSAEEAETLAVEAAETAAREETEAAQKAADNGKSGKKQ